MGDQPPPPPPAEGEMDPPAPPQAAALAPSTFAQKQAMLMGLGRGIPLPGMGGPGVKKPPGAQSIFPPAAAPSPPSASSEMTETRRASVSTTGSSHGDTVEDLPRTRPHSNTIGSVSSLSGGSPGGPPQLNSRPGSGSHSIGSWSQEMETESPLNGANPPLVPRKWSELSGTRHVSQGSISSGYRFPLREDGDDDEDPEAAAEEAGFHLRQASTSVSEMNFAASRPSIPFGTPSSAGKGGLTPTDERRLSVEYDPNIPIDARQQRASLSQASPSRVSIESTSLPRLSVTSDHAGALAERATIATEEEKRQYRGSVNLSLDSDDDEEEEGGRGRVSSVNFRIPEVVDEKPEEQQEPEPVRAPAVNKIRIPENLLANPAVAGGLLRPGMPVPGEGKPAEDLEHKTLERATGGPRRRPPTRRKRAESGGGEGEISTSGEAKEAGEATDEVAPLRTAPVDMTFVDKPTGRPMSIKFEPVVVDETGRSVGSVGSGKSIVLDGKAGDPGVGIVQRMLGAQTCDINILQDENRRLKEEVAELKTLVAAMNEERLAGPDHVLSKSRKREMDILDPAHESKVYKMGWMYKKGKIVKNWKKRWFVLHGALLSYYEGPKDSKPKGSIPVDSCAVEVVQLEKPSEKKKEKGVMQNALELIVDGRRWNLIADTQEESDEWLFTISLHMIRLNYAKNCKLQNEALEPRVLKWMDEPDTRSVDLSGSPLQLSCVIVIGQVLAMVTGLEELNLQGASLGDKLALFVGSLNFCVNLRELNLQNNCIDKEGGKVLQGALAQNRSLRMLRLDHNPIEDAGLVAISEAVANHPELSNMSLSHCMVGDVGIDAFCAALARKEIERVGALELTSNHIADQGAKSIAGLLRTRPVAFEHVNLRDNAIGDLGVTGLMFALETNNTVQSLDLEYNGYTTDGILAISKMLPVNTSLTKVEYAGYKLDLPSLSSLRIAASLMPGANVKKGYQK